MEDLKLRSLDFFKTLFIMLACWGFLSVIYFFILPKLVASLLLINQSESAFIKNEQGLVYEKNGDSDKAIVEYKKAIELDPLYDKTYNNIGISYASKKQYDLAEQSFKKAIELNPEYVKAYNNLGFLFIKQDKYLEAVFYLEKASTLDGTLTHLLER